MGEPRASWSELRAFMFTRCGVKLAEDQEYLMEARLSPVARTLKFASVPELVAAACRPAAPGEVTGALIDAMTTHETSFFRDPPFWKALVELVVPRLDHRGGQGPITVWSAACSTGQEAYTLSMLVEENLPSLAGRLRIIGTDVSEGVLEHARRGEYTLFEVNRGINAHRLLKHFERAKGHFRIAERHRQRVTFRPHNLVSDWPPQEGLDLVLLRNVLIYFPEAQRSTVLKKARAALRAHGALGLGTTELLPGGAALAPGWYPAR